MTLVTTTIHEKQAPFSMRDSKSSTNEPSRVRRNSGPKKLHNPLTKLAVWMGLNIFGDIIDLIESGLLLGADPADECRIIADN